MPVTKTAKRALRSSERKQQMNKRLSSKLEIATRLAKRQKTAKAVKEAVSAADIAAKKKLIHKNKAGRIKSMLSKLLVGKGSTEPKASTAKKTSKKTTKK